MELSKKKKATLSQLQNNCKWIGGKEKHWITAQKILLVTLLITLIFPVCALAGFLILPYKDGLQKSCGYGCYEGHTGVDYSGSVGKDVVAAYGGTIIVSSDTDAPNDSSIALPNSYGNYIKIDHGTINGRRIVTTYAHLLHGSFVFEKGKDVLKGQKIAESGNSGTSTGPHLHFQVNVNGIPKDPYNSGDYLWSNNPPIHQNPPVEKRVASSGDACWYPSSVSCENAQSWYKLIEPSSNNLKYTTAVETNSSICSQVVQDINTICEADSVNDAVPDKHWWQSWWRSFLNTYIRIPKACGAEFTQHIVTRNIVVYNNAEAAIISGNGTSITDATGKGYQSPAIEPPTHSLRWSGPFGQRTGIYKCKAALG